MKTVYNLHDNNMWKKNLSAELAKQISTYNIKLGIIVWEILGQGCNFEIGSIEYNI